MTITTNNKCVRQREKVNEFSHLYKNNNKRQKRSKKKTLKKNKKKQQKNNKIIIERYGKKLKLSWWNKE